MPKRFRVLQQNTALNEYLEKAHRQLEQCKQEKEEGKKYLEELQTQLAVKTTQVSTYCMIYMYMHCTINFKAVV